MIRPLRTSPPRPRRLAVLLLLPFFVSAPCAVAATLTVGSDAVQCDFTDLATAIGAAANEDILELEAMTFTGASGINFNIEGKSLDIRGGYEPGCQGERTLSAPTTLQGQGADSVIEIFGSGSHFVYLGRLTIFGGARDTDFGGGIEIDGSFGVILNDVEVALNESERGGGIHIDGSQGAALALASGTVIRLNEALRLDTSVPESGSGGGIYCENGASIDLLSPFELRDNVAGRHGGGLYATGCDVRVLPEGQGGLGGDVSIRENEAGDDGGGFYLTDGTDLDVDGGSGGAAWIRGNVASSSGGGVFVTGSGSYLEVTRSHVVENTAVSSGGGIYLANDAIADFEWEPCNLARCLELSRNEAVFGAAVVVVSRAQAEIAQTWITGNVVTVDSGSGAVGFASSGGNLELWNSMVVGNRTVSGLGDGAVFSLSGEVEILGSTFTGQENVKHVVTGSGDLLVENSIFWDNGSSDPFDPGWSGTRNVRCAIVPPGATPSFDVNVSSADPLFVSAEDPHLRKGSPAIDLCYVTGSGFDIDGESRPMGDRVDAGADEFSEPIFRDGFESGDFSAWSATVQ